MNEWKYESMSEYMIEWTEQTNNQSIHKSTNTERKKLTYKQIRSNQLTNHPTGLNNWPTDQPTYQPTNQPTN